jgi:hypothetical protein
MGVTVVEFIGERTQGIQFPAAKSGQGLGFGNQGLLSHGLVPPLLSSPSPGRMVMRSCTATSVCLVCVV